METGRWELVQEDVSVVFKVVRDGEGNVRAESLCLYFPFLFFVSLSTWILFLITMFCSLNAHIRLRK